MTPDQIKAHCVYDYRPPRAKGAYPCVWVDEIITGDAPGDAFVFFHWLEEDGVGGEVPLHLFARRCLSRRNARTWARIKP